MGITAVLSAAALSAGLALAVASPAAAATEEFCTEDAKYLVRAHRGNLAEVTSGQAALAESGNEGVRTIAGMLIRHHAGLDQKITDLAERHGAAMPPKPNQKQRDDLAAVAAMNGVEFDAAWLALQEKAHVQSLDFIGRELAGGCAPAVRDAARVAAVPVRLHLQEVREALKPRE